MKTQDLFIASKYVDSNLELNLPSFFYLMQSIAADDIEEKGIKKEQTLDQGCSWILSRVEVDFIDTPKFPSDVYLDTYPGDDLKFLFPRYYRIRNKDGLDLVVASSIWALLDIKNRTLTKPPFDQRLIPEHHEGELPLPKRIRVPDDGIFLETRKVRLSDTDLNCHLNNVKYIDYIVDALEDTLSNKQKIKHFTINYNHEIKKDQCVDLYTDENINPKLIWGKVDNQVAFISEIQFEDKK
ncbi:MAG: hypothetical protein HUJ59_05315 [Bacilli bacterium]|nr:hypothetical protein [Bacilli bacterium]